MVERHTNMDQIAKALGLINSFQLNGLSGTANPTSGARLNLSGGLESLTLTAQDGKALGVTISSQGFGVGNLSLPTPQDPSIALVPYLSDLQVQLHQELFERLADFAKEELLKGFHGVINRVVLKRLSATIRLTPDKIAHADIRLDHVYLQQGTEELIRLKDLFLTVLNYDTKLPPKLAQGGCKVILRSLRVEVEERLFALILKASATKIPSFVRNLHVELPGPQMVVGGNAKKSVFSTSFRVDLKFEAKNNLFGIYFDRFYVPGTNMKLPDPVKNMLLGFILGGVEKRAKGLIEVSNESLLINPWSRIPVDLITQVTQFEVAGGKILLSFGEPSDRMVPPSADEMVDALSREPQDGFDEVVLAPGPSL